MSEKRSSRTDEADRPSSYQLAASGRLPRWAVVRPERVAHIERVAELMDEWAVNLDLDEDERSRWRAIALLHDAIRDAPAVQLREIVGNSFESLPEPLLHGPAVATLLEHEGVTDTNVLLAVGYHTIGHPAFDLAGRALYLADFLEPGRDFEKEWRNELRIRMPADMDEILIDVAAARMKHLIDEQHEIRPETAIFWNSIVKK